MYYLLPLFVNTSKLTTNIISSSSNDIWLYNIVQLYHQNKRGINIISYVITIYYPINHLDKLSITVTSIINTMTYWSLYPTLYLSQPEALP
jgi:hypothetical protein